MRASRRLAIAVALLALAIAVSACDGKETTTVIERTVTGAQGTETSTATTPTAGGPRGSLDFAAVGPLRQGDSIERARELFGPPDRSQRNSGCELDPTSRSQTALTWSLPDGDLIIQFAGSEGLISYRTTSRDLPTRNGNRVGDSFQALRDSWGTALEPLNLGAPATSRAGFWFVRDAPRAELTFSIVGGKVATILGGHNPPCE
jgi:hypothetical protein